MCRVFDQGHSVRVAKLSSRCGFVWKAEVVDKKENMQCICIRCLSLNSVPVGGEIFPNGVKFEDHIAFAKNIEGFVAKVSGDP